MSSRPRKKQREPIHATYAYESGEAAAPTTTHASDDDSDDDMSDLPVEGGSVFEQLGAILEGSSDEEMVEVMSQVPALNDGTKLIIGMQKLSAEASAFTLLQPLAEACENEGIATLFRKIGALSESQVDVDITNVFADSAEDISNILSHPPELRRRRFFTSLAAGYLDH